MDPFSPLSTIQWYGRSLVILCLAFCLLLACNQTIPENQVLSVQDKGIDALLQDLEAMKTQTATPFQDLQTSYQQLNQATTQLTQTEEEMRKDLLSEVKVKDQEEFRQELETLFDVGKEKGFFLRQINYAKFKIDLAVVGIGIIRVHQVLRGENSAVKPKDTQEFIRYIKEQVQNALISNDKNYKAIVFKGIESSA